MKFDSSDRGSKVAGARAFTLAVKVVMATAIAALLCTAVVECYSIGAYRAQYAACSLAANMQAVKKIEQAIFANWIPNYGVTNVFNPALTNIDMENLDMLGSPEPTSSPAPITPRITQISTNPPYLMIRGGLCLGLQRPGHLRQHRRRLARAEFDPLNPSPSTGRERLGRGFTVAELMIASSILVLVFGAVVAVNLWGLAMRKDARRRNDDLES